MACLRPLLAFGICENLQKQTATVGQKTVSSTWILTSKLVSMVLRVHPPPNTEKTYIYIIMIYNGIHPRSQMSLPRLVRKISILGVVWSKFKFFMVTIHLFGGQNPSKLVIKFIAQSEFPNFDEISSKTSKPHLCGAKI